MKVYQTNEIKNIALLGNDGSGKTTLTEALLYESGIIKHRKRLLSGRTGIWIFCLFDHLPCRMEREETEHHRLPGQR